MVAKFNNKSGGGVVQRDAQASASMTNSRLGQILVGRGYLAQTQLDFALRQQADAVRAGRGKPMRLGEWLVVHSLITERDLKRALRQQSRLRLAATVLAAISAPLQPMMAFAATTNAPVIVPVPKSSSPFVSPGYMIAGLQPMVESEMRGVTAQGFDHSLAVRFRDDMLAADMLAADMPAAVADVDGQVVSQTTTLSSDKGLDAVKVLEQLGKVLLPFTQVLEADIQVAGVHIAQDRIKPLFDNTGAMNVTLPNLIERVSFRDIRPAGQIGGSTFGTVQLEGIRFSDEARIRIRPY